MPADRPTPSQHCHLYEVQATNACTVWHFTGGAAKAIHAPAGTPQGQRIPTTPTLPPGSVPGSAARCGTLALLTGPGMREMSVARDMSARNLRLFDGQLCHNSLRTTDIYCRCI